MKNLIIAVSVLLSSQLYSQNNSETTEEVPLELKHIKGVKGIELNFGKGGNNGNHFQAMFDFYTGSNTMIGVGAVYENVKIGKTDLSNILVRPSVYYTLVDAKKVFFLNVIGGVFLGSEKLDKYTTENGKNTFPEINTFLYGGIAGVNAELYINTKTSITLTGEQYYNPASTLGDTKYAIMGGIRIYFSN